MLQRAGPRCTVHADGSSSDMHRRTASHSSAGALKPLLSSGMISSYALKDTHRPRRHRLAPVRSASAEAIEETPTLAAATEACKLQFPPLETARFVRDGTQFAEEYRIMGHEAGPDQRATPIAVANLLQEVASNHAVAMWGRSANGFANLPSMKESIFVMTRLHLQMHGWPSWGDRVAAETWFMEETRLSCRRDTMLACAATGALLAGASTQWVVINAATRRLSKMPEDLRRRFRPFSKTPPRYAVPKEEAKRRVPDLPAGVAPSAGLQAAGGFTLNGAQTEEGGTLRRLHITRRSDIDMNGHVNNVAYLLWALDTLPTHISREYQLTELELEFKAECNAGDLVESLAMPYPQTGDVGTPLSNGDTVHFLHHIYCHPQGAAGGGAGGRPQELVRARTSWRPRPGAAPGAAAAADPTASGSSNGNGNGAGH